MRRKAVRGSTEQYYSFFFCLAGVIVLFSADWMPEYASDTYATYVESLWRFVLHDNLRPITAAIYYLSEDFFHTHQNATYMISYWMGIVFLTLAVFTLARRLDRDVDNWVLAAAAALLIIANLYIIEYFLFVETGMFMLAIFLSVLAFDRTVEFFETGKRRMLLYALICLLAVVNIYQIFPGLYVVLCLPYILKYGHSAKKFLGNNLVVASLYALPLITMLLVSKSFLQSSRLGFTWGGGTYSGRDLPVFQELHHHLRLRWPAMVLRPDGFCTGCAGAVLCVPQKAVQKGSGADVSGCSGGVYSLFPEFERPYHGPHAQSYVPVWLPPRTDAGLPAAGRGSAGMGPAAKTVGIPATGPVLCSTAVFLQQGLYSALPMQ